LPETEELFSPPAEIAFVHHVVVLWRRDELGYASKLRYIVRNGGQNFLKITFRSKKFRPVRTTSESVQRAVASEAFTKDL